MNKARKYQSKVVSKLVVNIFIIPLLLVIFSFDFYSMSLASLLSGNVNIEFPFIKMSIDILLSLSLFIWFLTNIIGIVNNYMNFKYELNSTLIEALENKPAE